MERLLSIHFKGMISLISEHKKTGIKPVFLFIYLSKFRIYFMKPYGVIISLIGLGESFCDHLSIEFVAEEKHAILQFRKVKFYFRFINH
jgi:hypothetical protein